MTRYLPIIDDPVDDDQKAILEALLWHVTNEDDHGPITTWPTWDHVKFLLRQQGIPGQRVDGAAAAFPQLARHRFPYSLIWRSEPGASQPHIQPRETVGLTMAGLMRVDSALASRLATMIAGYASQEESLPPNPTGVREARVELNGDLERWVLPPERRSAGRKPMNVRSAAELLMHEYHPLATETGFQWIYEVVLGGDRLTSFLGISTPEEYIRALVPPETAEESDPSPAGQGGNLPQTVPKTDERSTAVESATAHPPRVFIGSSVEALPAAEALQRLLQYGHEVTLWGQGVFAPGQFNLEALIEATEENDFAIFVVSADDTTVSRDEIKQATRDNVIFELGLFIGALGRKQCFMVYDESRKPALPSDLGGVVPVPYRLHRSGKLDSSMGAAASTIKVRINRIWSARSTSNPEAQSEATRPFDGASGDPLEALHSEIQCICENAAAQGWRTRNTDTTLRVWNRKRERFSFELGEPVETRERLRGFVNKLRASGLRVNRRVRVPVAQAPVVRSSQ